MKVKYTLRLETNGKEVWKRWTGDREEMIRLAAAAVVDLNAHAMLAESFVKCLAEENLKGMVPNETWGFAVNSRDLTSTLHLEVRTTAQE